VSATLAEIWERRDGGALSASTYVEVGGLASAVQRLGNQAIDRVGAAHVDELRSVLRSLADITEEGAWTRRRVTVDEVADRSRSIDALVDARLVVRDEHTVEIAHEAVFRAWPQLAEWLEEARSDMLLEREARVAARAWDVDGRLDDNVYRGTRLHATLEWAERHTGDLPAVVDDFLEAGRRLEEREQQVVRDQLARERRARRRLSWALTVAAVLLALAIIAGAVAVVSRGHAQDAAALAERRQAEAEAAQRDTARESERARVARLVAESERHIDTQFDRALLLAVEARRRDDSLATQGALFTALTADLSSEDPNGASSSIGAAVSRDHSAFLGFLSGPPRGIYIVASSADGRVIVAAGDNEDVTGGLAVVFDTATRLPIGRIETADRMYEAMVSADGRYVVASDYEEVHRLDLTTGEDIVRRDIHAQLMLLPDGKRFAHVGRDGYDVWDIASLSRTSEPRPLFGAPMKPVGSAPDGSMLIVDAFAADLAVFVDVETGAEVRRVALEPPHATVGELEFEYSLSADGSTLAGSEMGGRVFLWDLATGAVRGSSGPGQAWTLSFHPADADQLAISQMAGGVALYDVGRDRPLGEKLRGDNSRTLAVAYSADGTILAAGADNGLVSLWGRNDQDSLIVDHIGVDLTRPVMSPNGAATVFTAQDGQKIWITDDLAAAPTRYVHRRDGETVVPLFAAMRPLVSADGSTILAVDEAHTDLVAADASTGVVFWSTDASQPSVRFNAAINPDGGLVTSATLTSLYVWDTRSGDQLARIPFAELSSKHLSAAPRFSADGSHIYIPMADEVVRLSVPGFEPDLRLQAPSVVATVSDVAGADAVIAGGVDGVLVRWDTSTGDVVATGHTSGSAIPNYATVSPDGRLLAIDRALRAEVELFDATTLTALGGPMTVGDSAFIPNFTADSRGLLGNGVHNDATRWELDPNEWQQQACFAAGRNLTQEEWTEYIGSEEPYRATCEQWPDG
jgi:WD40 repeat protein